MYIFIRQKQFYYFSTVSYMLLLELKQLPSGQFLKFYLISQKLPVVTVLRLSFVSAILID